VPNGEEEITFFRPFNLMRGAKRANSIRGSKPRRKRSRIVCALTGGARGSSARYTDDEIDEFLAQPKRWMMPDAQINLLLKIVIMAFLAVKCFSQSQPSVRAENSSDSLGQTQEKTMDSANTGKSPDRELPEKSTKKDSVASADVLDPQSFLVLMTRRWAQ
jgi:hypothetical protein